MKLLNTIVKIGIPLLVLIGATWSVYVLWSAGGFDDEIVTRIDGQCRQVAGVTGPEDIVIDAAGGTAYLSGRDLRAAAAAREGKGQVVPGAIYAYDLTAGEGAAAVNLTPDAGAAFQPHGLSLLRQDGVTWLFAVNHPGNGHEVIRYRLSEAEGGGPRLVESGRFESPLLISPNDLHAVDTERFYVTNDRGSGARFMHAVESFLHLPRSTVVYRDPDGWRVVADDIVFANGINATADNGRVLVGSVVEKQVYLYDRDPGSGALTEAGRLEMPMGVDNIDRDPQGRFWIAGHPKLFTFVAHAGDPAAPSPGMVVRTTLSGDDGGETVEVLREDGKMLSAMSVAAPYADRLLLGGVFSGYFLDCRMSPAAMGR